ncbi:hypothetical protein Tco_0367716 [Tanacetum coccineum]
MFNHRFHVQEMKQSSGIVSDEEIEQKEWSTLRFTWQKFRKSYLQNQVLRHWNSQNDSFRFEHELKTEMHEDYEYVKSLEKEVDELESENGFEIQFESKDKNIAISELKKLIENCKGKSVETQFNKPSVVRQPNAQRIPKLSSPKEFVGSNDMVHNYYLEKAKKSAQLQKDKDVNGKPSRISTVGLWWVPQASYSTLARAGSKVYQLHGLNVDYPFISCISQQTLGLSAADQASVFMEMMSVHISSGLVLHQMTSDHNRSELRIQDHSNEQSSSKLVPKVVP